MTPAIELRGLCKSFGATTVLRGLDLKIMEGERVALIGPNGAGKSTLFDAISGRVRPSGGEVLLRGSADRRSSAARDQSRRAGAQLPDH